MTASTGNNNTALGYQAGLAITTGGTNTLIGYQAGNTITTGTQNVIIGNGAQIVSSNYNAGVAIGNGAITSDGGITIGSGATGGVASIVLGRGAAATGANQFVVGSATNNAGTVTTETNTTASYWQVKVNGTDRKIPLWDTMQNLFNTRQAVAVSTTTTSISWANGNIVDATLTSNTTFTFTSPVVGTYVLLLMQSGSGSYTVTWPANIKWSGGAAPTLTTTIGKEDVITLVYDGTNYFGSYSLNH